MKSKENCDVCESHVMISWCLLCSFELGKREKIGHM